MVSSQKTGSIPLNKTLHHARTVCYAPQQQLNLLRKFRTFLRLPLVYKIFHILSENKWKRFCQAKHTKIEQIRTLKAFHCSKGITVTIINLLEWLQRVKNNFKEEEICFDCEGRNLHNGLIENYITSFIVLMELARKLFRSFGEWKLMISFSNNRIRC